MDSAAQYHAVRIADVRRLQRGVLQRAANVPEGKPARAVLEQENLDRARAAALMCKRAAISHQSAAIAHGVPTYGDLARSCLTVPAGTPLRRLAKVHLHRATMSEMNLVLIGGHSVTVAARTVMDPHTGR